MCENITCNMSENKSLWYQSLPSIIFFFYAITKPIPMPCYQDISHVRQPHNSCVRNMTLILMSDRHI